MNKISESYYNAPILSLFVPYNLRRCKKHLETLCTLWWGPGMCSYVTGVQLPAPWEKIIFPFLFHGPKRHLIPCTPQSNSCKGLTDSGCLEVLQATEGGAGRVLWGTPCEGLPCGRRLLLLYIEDWRFLGEGPSLESPSPKCRSRESRL